MIAFFCRLVPLHSLNHQPACPSISPACSSKHMIRIKIICWSIVVYFAFSVLPLLYCKVTNVSGCSRLCSGRSGVLGTRYVVRRPVQEEMMTMTVCPEAQSGIQLSEKKKMRRWFRSAVRGARKKKETLTDRAADDDDNGDRSPVHRWWLFILHLLGSAEQKRKAAETKHCTLVSVFLKKLVFC